MKRAWWILSLWPSLALADTVYLKSGRTVSGAVVERTAETLVLDIGPGRIGIPLAQVERVVAGDSTLEQFRSRAARLERSDAQGWLELAAWAQAHDLNTQAREAYEHVAALQPDNAVAQQALGKVSLDGRWLSFEEAQRARGLVEYEGEWITPGERAQALAAQSAAAVARRADAEAEARVREAEARAREAEARARQAEAEANGDTYYDDGVPLWLGGGGGFLLPGACEGRTCGPGCARPCVDPDQPPPQPQPPPAANPPRSRPQPQPRGGGSAPAPAPRTPQKRQSSGR